MEVEGRQGTRVVRFGLGAGPAGRGRGGGCPRAWWADAGLAGGDGETTHSEASGGEVAHPRVDLV